MLHFITYIFRYEFMYHDVLTRNVVKSYMKSGGTKVPDEIVKGCKKREEERALGILADASVCQKTFSFSE